MGSYVLGLQEIDRGQVAIVGGKGAHLGELARIDGVRVPPGFCVTTEAFERIVGNAPELAGPLDRLANLDPDDRDAISAGSAEVRQALEAIVIPDDLAAEITGALVDGRAYAVRSSATAEDLPGASFAGQQDTYLNVLGTEAVLRHVSRCWASLFTERAVTYRLRNGFDHRKVHMAVVVQEMVFPRAAGVLFTADPVTSNRKVAIVEASFGLGEALVSGLVNADNYQVRDGEIVDKAISAKQRAILPVEGGGTEEQVIAADQQEQAALTDDQVLRLVSLGRTIEAHFGRPQDIEWCLAEDEFQIVQSRPITTLFPIPEATGEGNRVYVSVGHQQMMTDAMKPLGLSVWQLTTPRPMAEAGGRLFADATPLLSVAKSRAGFLAVAGKSDPLMGDALETVLSREGFLPLSEDDGPGEQVPGVAPATIETDPAVVTELIQHNEASLATLRREIAAKSGNELLDFLFADIEEMRRILFDPRSHQVFTAAMQASWWLNDHLQEWLGEKNVADTLTQSVPHNVTAEMGLALLDVADVLREHPEVVAFLQDVQDNGFLDELPKLAGGEESRAAIQGYLDKYGMRCVGEIDITRPRWSEQPLALVPMLLSNIKNFEPGAGKRRFEQGRQEALDKAREVLERLRALPDGEAKAEETERMIERVRTFTGYREYPKYGMVSRYFGYKQALLGEAERLVAAGVLAEPEDLFFLRLQEFREVVRTNEVDRELIQQRKEAFHSYESLTPPRVLTSDGEAVSGKYRRDDLPEGALVGLPVSAGTIEGRARVILDLADADLEPGDILVTAYTDPSWSPLFVAITGLVTEVGGQMTHGAVIAREYGLPAVVGVQNATQLIKDGQRIRVNGTEGYLEVLDAE
ncbi:phosphoenolpyruvate synthase [Amycolatopsis sp. AA4]|uniref:rifamycin-inactivating phosphotransferase n=1 Tax=Actinomycetes TaxID=1760 RepID=UPI0001B556B2|nr:MULTISPECIES: rifamycin-inactivating phosphotransferase [Actinomycetes]ATY15609.1 phosphoenolpyruvate synthase [Amycolatopsis sp. AA4]EFL11896.1 phosphoenolpyruvate synthase [Streptomyces sp. AA4]